jgi:excisionase family DNA binding protein
MEKVFTVEEAAEQLRVGTETIRRYTKSGKLKAKKIGRRWLIPASQLDSVSESAERPSPKIQFSSGASAAVHNRKILELASAPLEVQQAALAAAEDVAARYYGSAQGRAELADWRALDGEDFHDAD